MKRSPLLLVLALMAAALALTACGGGGKSSSGGGSASSSSSPTSSDTADTAGADSGSSADQAAIEATITKAATVSDPAKCTQLQTAKYNEAGGTFTAKEGTVVCEHANEVEQPPAGGVEVTNVDFAGETATAEVALEGSTLNGQTIELELIKEAGQWKMNQFLTYVDYDPQAAGEGVEERLQKVGEPATVVKCMGAGYAEFSQSEAEEVSMKGNVQPVEELLSRCG